MNLVERLRNGRATHDELEDAADRIEKLEAELAAEKDEVFRLQASHTALYDNRRQDWERWVWLRDWLVRYGLLHYEKCQPEAKMQCGRYWIFRKPAVIDSTHVEGWATTATAAIDAARAGGQWVS